MSLFKSNGRHRKQATIGMAAVLGVAGIAAAAIAFSSGSSEAAESCQGLDTALQNNQNFIAAQKANPDAQSEARIANRQAVVDLIQQRRQAAGCNGNAAAQPPAQNNGGGAAEEQPAEQPANNGGVGEVVCAGSTVTLSGEAGAPAASSSQFPIGTQLKVTNLDNNKSTTVEVTGASGSCALLNDAAFEQVREPGKFLIRRAKIERVG
jgi:rare lipoprotein A (peptidoglycan hydrolase)